MARREIEITAAIKDSALFRGLPLVALSRLAAIAQALHLARGSHLYRAGERSRGVYTLVTGRIMLSVGTSTSNTKVVELAGPGSHIGLAEGVLDMPENTTAEILADSKLILIRREAILECAAEHAEFALKLIVALSREVCALTADIEALALRSGRERVADYLLQIAAGNATRQRAITLPAKKSIIASRLNLTPEYFSRTLHDLITAGAIAVNGRQITVLDPVRLRATYR